MGTVLWPCAPWIAAVIGAAAYGVSSANYHSKMHGQLPPGWWKSTAHYAAYAILVCCLWTVIALWHEGFV